MQAIRVATFRVVMGKECLQIFLNLNLAMKKSRLGQRCLR